MATMLRVEGTTETITPAGKHLDAGRDENAGRRLDRSGSHAIDGRFMVIDEEGKIKKKPLNIQATRLYLHGRYDPIVGTALLFDTKAEMDRPEEDDDENDEAP